MAQKKKGKEMNEAETLISEIRSTTITPVEETPEVKTVPKSIQLKMDKPVVQDDMVTILNKRLGHVQNIMDRVVLNNYRKFVNPDDQAEFFESDDCMTVRIARGASLRFGTVQAQLEFEGETFVIIRHDVKATGEKLWFAEPLEILKNYNRKLQ